MWRENYRRKTISPGHQPNASTSLITPIHTLTHWWMRMYRDVSPTTQIRAEVRMKSGHSIWAKYREASEVIDLHGLFNEYWSSNDHEFTVLSQSLSPTAHADLIVKDRGRCHWKT